MAFCRQYLFKDKTDLKPYLNLFRLDRTMFLIIKRPSLIQQK